MMRWLQSSWLAAAVGCLLYLGVTAVLIRPARFVAAREAQHPRGTSLSDDGPSWTFKNPEFDQWVQEIRHEREALALRKQRLEELQTRLDSERQELETTTQTVYRLQTEFNRNVVRIEQQQVENLKRQAKVMAGMSPDSAASLLNEMPENDAVRILFTMKSDEASAILESLSKSGPDGAKRAAVLTERLGRALPPASGGRSPNSS